MDMSDRDPAKVGVGPFAGCKAQTALDGPRKPLVDNPESVFGRDGRESRVVAQNFVNAVFANKGEQLLMDIAKLAVRRVLSPDHDEAMIGLIVPDRADRVVTKILQQLKALTGFTAQQIGRASCRERCW